MVTCFFLMSAELLWDHWQPLPWYCARQPGEIRHTLSWKIKVFPLSIPWLTKTPIKSTYVFCCAELWKRHQGLLQQQTLHHWLRGHWHCWSHGNVKSKVIKKCTSETFFSKQSCLFWHSLKIILPLNRSLGWFLAWCCAVPFATAGRLYKRHPWPTWKTLIPFCSHSSRKTKRLADETSIILTEIRRTTQTQFLLPFLVINSACIFSVKYTFPSLKKANNNKTLFRFEVEKVLFLHLDPTICHACCPYFPFF